MDVKRDTQTANTHKYHDEKRERRDEYSYDIYFDEHDHSRTPMQ